MRAYCGRCKLPLFALGVTVLWPAAAGAAWDDTNLDAVLEDMTVPPAAGETTRGAPSAAGVEDAAPAFRLEGVLQPELHVPLLKNHQDFNGYFKAPKVLNELGLSYQQGDLSLESRWALDLVMPPGGKQADLLDARPRQNALSWNPPGWKFGFGYQIFKWGTSDEMNPTDNLNPKDYRRAILEVISIPVLSASATAYLSERFALDAVYIPYAQSYNFPVDVADQIPPSLFAPAEISEVQPPFTAESAVAGARLNLYSTWDLSASYVYDFDPYFTPVIRYGSPLDKSLDLVRERIHRFGLDAKTTLDRFGVWLEACYSLPRGATGGSPARRRPFLSWTLGTDFNYGPGDEFYVNFQYAGTYVVGFDAGFFRDYPGGLPDPLRMLDPAYAERYLYRALTQRLGDQNEQWLHRFILKLDWPLAHREWTPSFVAVYDLPAGYDRAEKVRYGSLLLNPEIVYAPRDAFQVALGAEWFGAWQKPAGSDRIVNDDSDRLGRFQGDSNLYLEVRYSWDYTTGP